MTISQSSVRLGISVNVLANRWQKNNKIISNQKYILTNQWKKDKKTLHIDQVHGSGDKWFIQSSIITENDIESNLQFVFSGIKVSRGSLHYLWLEHTSFVSLPSSKVRTMKFQNLSPHMLTHSLHDCLCESFPSSVFSPVCSCVNESHFQANENISQQALSSLGWWPKRLDSSGVMLSMLYSSPTQLCQQPEC